MELFTIYSHKFILNIRYLSTKSVSDLIRFMPLATDVELFTDKDILLPA